MSKPAPASLVWFRNDLRLEDHSALASAAQSGHPLVAVFLVCLDQWRSHDVADERTDFLLRNLAELWESLERLKIPLLVLDCRNFASVPETLAGLCTELGISDVHCNIEYGLNEMRRDESTRAALEREGVQLVQHTDQVLFEPGTLLTGSGDYYKVYSSFRKKWLSLLDLGQLEAAEGNSLKGLQIKQAPKGQLNREQLEALRIGLGAGSLVSLYPAGEQSARMRLSSFVSERGADYKERRDFPAVKGTSGLSPWLSAGVISVRACLRAAIAANQGQAAGGDEGLSCWINELIWREFYRHVLVGFPHVNCNLPFRRETDQIPWRDNMADFQRWRNGETGYPLVDAGMRQLNETGWMHNRLRMVTAMFLAKHLLIDWRMGERYFMQKLIDGDFASNNGGWQWSASTGTDAVPYFRIFNPVTQSKRFDTEGTFIRMFVPELDKLSPRHIHEPDKHRSLFPDMAYPPPMVDHKAARQRVMDAFSGGPDP